jgi:DNA adenine methylase
MASPFLKWAGGKRQLMTEIMGCFPSDLSEYDYYVEPFLGGGSVLIELLNRGYNGKVIAGDINKDIISCYLTIQSNVEELIQALYKISRALPVDLDERKPVYYAMRKEWNNSVGKKLRLGSRNYIRRVALTIALNKTCYNGLFRLNSNGEFNVPMGGTKNLTIFSAENLQNLNKLFETVSFVHGDYTNLIDMVSDDERSFFYFDPPYRRLKETSSLTMYNEDPFGDDEQLRLRDHVKKLVLSGHSFLLSNSDPKNIDASDNFFDNAYRDFSLYRIQARRSINSVADGRGQISELLISNLKPQGGLSNGK